MKVNVPAGVEDGQQMRLSGQGEAGTNGGPYGDLYVVFRVEESDIFDRDGSEIYYELPLNFVQAALGDEVNVPTVHGNVKLKFQLVRKQAQLPLTREPLAYGEAAMAINRSK